MMHFGVLLLLALVHFGGSEDVQDHISAKGKSVFLTQLEEDPPCPGLFSCLSCSEARVCRPTGPGSWDQVKVIPCSDPTPFCDYATGTCSTSADSSCGEKNDTFICPKDSGHFPDPLDSTAYHVCQSYSAAKFLCAPSLQYDPVAEDCIKPKVAERLMVDCKDKEGQKASFPGYETYFAYCSGGSAVVVDRCLGEYQLNSTSQACEPTCLEDGILRDWEDCTRFYLCSTLYLTRTQTFQLKQRMDCPEGRGFDPVLRMCSDLKDIPYCKGTTTLPPTTEPHSTTPAAL